jgi:hypothetical protein
MHNQDFVGYIERCIELASQEIEKERERAKAYELISENSPGPDRAGWLEAAERCRTRVTAELEHEINELRKHLS